VSCWALVPVKTPAEGKRRLAAILDERARATLVRRMLHHVLVELRGCALLDAVAVMTPDRDTLPEDIHLVADSGGGLNQALRAALTELSARGATRVAIISADLPRLVASEVTALIALSTRARIALAPDRRGGGTNAIALTVPSDFRPCFGPGSLLRHRAECARLGVAAEVVCLPGLEFDVDEPQDLELLHGSCPDNR